MNNLDDSHENEHIRQNIVVWRNNKTSNKNIQLIERWSLDLCRYANLVPTAEQRMSVHSLCCRTEPAQLHQKNYEVRKITETSWGPRDSTLSGSLNQASNESNSYCSFSHSGLVMVSLFSTYNRKTSKNWLRKLLSRSEKHILNIPEQNCCKAYWKIVASLQLL